jgi:hypothetical protein
VSEKQFMKGKPLTVKLFGYVTNFSLGIPETVKIKTE